MTPRIRIYPALLGTKSARLIPELTQRFGGRGNDAYLFVLDAPEHDPRINEVVSFLEAHGVTSEPPLREQQSASGHYVLQRLHGFEPSDFSRAEYLWLEGVDESHVDTDGDRDADGLLAVIASSIPKRGKLFDAGAGCLLVSATLRAELEAEGFIGLGFGPTKQAKEQRRGETYVTLPYDPLPDQALWELIPSVELPRMHAEVIRVATAPDIPAGEQGPGFLRNPGFNDAQIVYARSALQRVGSFDVARTWEYMFQREPECRFIVVSQRFYQFCKAKKLPAKFVPVKIVEE